MTCEFTMIEMNETKVCKEVFNLRDTECLTRFCHLTTDTREFTEYFDKDDVIIQE